MIISAFIIGYYYLIILALLPNTGRTKKAKYKFLQQSIIHTNVCLYDLIVIKYSYLTSDFFYLQRKILAVKITS